MSLASRLKSEGTILELLDCDCGVGQIIINSEHDCLCEAQDTLGGPLGQHLS